MGRVKEFALWLQDCLDRNLSDEDILAILDARWGGQLNKNHRSWVLEQITYLRGCAIDDNQRFPIRNKDKEHFDG